MNYPCLVWHTNLGLCKINQTAIVLQRQRGTESSIFVEHRGELVEVTRSMVEPEWTPMTIAPPYSVPVMVRDRTGKRVERRVNTAHYPVVRLVLLRNRSSCETDFEPKEWLPAP